MLSCQQSVYSANLDERAPQTLGRAGDPDDYLGMVLVEGGGKVSIC